VSEGHYFNADPSVASDRQMIPLHLPDLAVDLETDRGVFSGGQIDAGTRLLLLEGARPAIGEQVVLDLGCGYGPLAIAAATRAPQATVWAVDVNERAIGLCADNAKRLGLTNITACTADQVPDDVRFDLIVSNPPIRVGKAVLHEMLQFWCSRLRPSGHAELVVQKHLGSDSLHRWLNEQGFPTVRRLSRGGYRILDVAAPTARDANAVSTT